MISEFDLVLPLIDLAAKYYPNASPIRQRLIWKCPNGSNLFLYVKSFYCFQLQSWLDCTGERERLFVELEMDDSIEWNWDGKKSIIRTNGILVSLMTFHFLSISAYEMANSGTGKECKKPPHKSGTGIKIFPKFATGKGMKNPIPQFEHSTGCPRPYKHKGWISPLGWKSTPFSIVFQKGGDIPPIQG